MSNKLCSFVLMSKNVLMSKTFLCQEEREAWNPSKFSYFLAIILLYMFLSHSGCVKVKTSPTPTSTQ